MKHTPFWLVVRLSEQLLNLPLDNPCLELIVLIHGVFLEVPLEF